jgi:hypothetical protein
MHARFAGGVIHWVGTPCAASECGPGAAGPYRRDRDEGRAWLSPHSTTPHSTVPARHLPAWLPKRPARIATRRVAGGCWRACHLWLVRDTRRGEKAHDQQRRLKRFREQRPGGL